MDQYILNILPRIIKAGKKLNQLETIVDKVWIKYGEDDYETYRFSRNNVVLVSQGGVVEEKKWELLTPNGLYIGKDGKGHMYRQVVVFGSLLLLQIESKNFQPVLFYDELKIPDGDVVGYLKHRMDIEKEQEELKSGRSDSGHQFPHSKQVKAYQTQVGMLVIKRDFYNVSIIDSEAYINDTPAPDGKYITIDEPVFKWIKVKQGIVTDFEQH